MENAAAGDNSRNLATLVTGFGLAYVSVVTLAMHAFPRRRGLAADLMWLHHYKLFGVTQGLTAAYAVWLVTMTAIGSGTGREAFGGLSNLLGRFPTLFSASLFGMVLFLLLALGMPHLLIIIIAGLVGIVFGTWQSLYGPISTDLFGLRAAGAVYGALYLSNDIGGIIGPIGGAYLADHFHGGYRLAFLAAALQCAQEALIFLVAMRGERFVYLHDPAATEEYPLD